MRTPSLTSGIGGAERAPHVTSQTADAALLAGRLLLVALYLVSAAGKWADLGGVVNALASQGLPLPSLLGPLAAAAELGGALLVVLGFRTRIAAAGLVAYSLLATLVFHDFWTLADPALRDGQFLHFMKNLGLIGGFLLLVGAGPGRFSLDARRTRL